MPHAKDVASELRKFADALDAIADLEIEKPNMYFTSWGNKEKFLNLAKAMPRPFAKTYKGINLEIGYKAEALGIYASIEREILCRLVEPAKPAVYECDPILSQEEESVV